MLLIFHCVTCASLGHCTWQSKKPPSQHRHNLPNPTNTLCYKPCYYFHNKTIDLKSCSNIALYYSPPSPPLSSHHHCAAITISPITYFITVIIALSTFTIRSFRTQKQVNKGRVHNWANLSFGSTLVCRADWAFLFLVDVLWILRSIGSEHHGNLNFWSRPNISSQILHHNFHKICFQFAHHKIIKSHLNVVITLFLPISSSTKMLDTLNHRICNLHHRKHSLPEFTSSTRCRWVSYTLISKTKSKELG